MWNEACGMKLVVLVNCEGFAWVLTWQGSISREIFDHFSSGKKYCVYISSSKHMRRGKFDDTTYPFNNFHSPTAGQTFTII